MYRQYENPHVVETLLEEAQRRYSDAQASRACDPDELYDFYIEVEELEQRANFAWQDEEWG